MDHSVLYGLHIEFYFELLGWWIDGNETTATSHQTA